MANDFSGEERNALRKMKELIQYLQRRDERAQDPKKTAALSTRTLVIDNGDMTIGEAFTTVERRIDDCLEAQRGDTLPASYMSSSKAQILTIGANAKKTELGAALAKPGTVITVANVRETQTEYDITSTSPELAGQKLTVRYTWSELINPEDTFVDKCDDKYGETETDKFFDRA